MDSAYTALVCCEFVATGLLSLLLLNTPLVNHSRTGRFRQRPNVSRTELRQRILFWTQPRLVAGTMPTLPLLIPTASFPQPTHYLHRTVESSNNNDKLTLWESLQDNLTTPVLHNYQRNCHNYFNSISTKNCVSKHVKNQVLYSNSTVTKLIKMVINIVKNFFKQVRKKTQRELANAGSPRKWSLKWK